MRDTLLVSDHVAPQDLQALLEREIGPEAKATVVTIGQQLIQQGIQQGKLTGERELLLRQLRHRFGDAVDADAERRIDAGTGEPLATWAERVLSATSVADAFAD